MPNSTNPRALKMAEVFAAYLREKGLFPCIFEYDYGQTTYVDNLEKMDLLIVLGGDGTLLRAGQMCAPLGIPLLGAQAGRLGFLTELDEENWQNKLLRLLEGDYRLEKRMMLSVEHRRQGKTSTTWDVINDVVISRGRFVRPIEIRVDLMEGYLTSYIADGLIVSTATGSTAYALAAGGPILPPELRNMLIVPIAPHLSLDRAVVLAEGATVELRTQCDHEAVMSVDGSFPVTMENDDCVRITGNKFDLKMIRFGEPNYFYKGLTGIMQTNPMVKQMET